MIKIYEFSNGKTVKVHLQKKGESCSMFGYPGWHDTYKLIMDFGYGKFQTTYHNSIANYHKPIKEEDIDDAVLSVINDFSAYKNYPNICNFLHEFGYDFGDEEEYKRGIKAYYGCLSIYTRLGMLVRYKELIELEKTINGE